MKGGLHDEVTTPLSHGCIWSYLGPGLLQFLLPQESGRPLHLPLPLHLLLLLLLVLQIRYILLQPLALQGQPDSGLCCDQLEQLWVIPFGHPVVHGEVFLSENCVCVCVGGGGGGGGE